MDSKTVPFSALQEIADLKKRVSELEHTLRIAAGFITRTGTKASYNVTF